MGNLSIGINGQQYSNLELRQVKEGVSLKEAQQTLAQQKDGLDAVGVNIEGIDYLITGTGINAKEGDAITIEGHAAGKVAFVENEDNTFGEGWQKGLRKKMGGLEKSVGGAGFVLQNGLIEGVGASIKGMRANTQTIESLTQGPAIDKKVLEDTVKAMREFLDFHD